MSETVGQRIVAERTARGWSQAYLAGRLFMNPAQLNRWERGATSPSAKNLRRLSEALGCTIDSLIPRTGAKS
jgi:transcriptional regulator with XRE-family HTH domain